MAFHRKPKQRLDALLVERHLFLDRKIAHAWIMSGKVLVDGRRVTKPGTSVHSEAEVLVRGLDQKYASRGGVKLEAALTNLGVSMTDKVVLDAGAATGGFTDCALQNGALLVYAVDAGYGQLRGRLAADPRVRNMERTNISDVRREHLVPAIDLCIVDLSYLSLTRAIPILKALFEKPVLMICLIKPPFESVTQDEKGLGRCSIVLESIFHASETNGLNFVDLIVSPILGSRGTIEFLTLLSDSLPPSRGFLDLRKHVLSDAAKRFGVS